MWTVMQPVSIINLATCPNSTMPQRVRKHRKYVFPKFYGKHHRPLLGIRNSHRPQFFIGHPSVYHPPSTGDIVKMNFSSFSSHSPPPVIKTENGFRFDSDSFRIGVDNQSSFSISNNLDDFITPPSPINAKLLGINGVSAILGRGTVRWHIDDDDGRTHPITLPNTLYVPSSPMCLLSPQHWAQVMKDHLPEAEGTWCATYSRSVILYWDQRKYKRTIAISPRTNTPVL